MAATVIGMCSAATYLACGKCTVYPLEAKVSSGEADMAILGLC